MHFALCILGKMHYIRRLTYAYWSLAGVSFCKYIQQLGQIQIQICLSCERQLMQAEGTVAMSYGRTEINTEATRTTNPFNSSKKNMFKHTYLYVHCIYITLQIYLFKMNEHTLKILWKYLAVADPKGTSYKALPFPPLQKIFGSPNLQRKQQFQLKRI